MNLAIFIMMLTALPVIYYYGTLYQWSPRIKYIFGMIGGLWGFVGVFLISSGSIGFGYFVIYVSILITGYIVEVVMGAGTEKKKKKKPFSISNLAMGVVVFIVVALMYSAFFITAVSPARVNDPTGFDESGEQIKTLPSTYKYEYKSTAMQSYVVVITIRTVPLTTGFYESALKKAKPYIEDYIRENYNQDAQLEDRGSEKVKINGHDGIKQTYDVKWQTLGGTKTATMVLEAFFCNEDFETIVIGYVYLPGAAAATLGLVGNVEC